MKKLILLQIVMITLFLGCNKNELSKNSANQSIIENAKSFFNESSNQGIQIGDQINSTESKPNPRLSRSRTVLWGKASIIQNGNSSVVIVPVQYLNNFEVESNFAGSGLYAINDLVKLCVYSDKLGQLHSEMLSFFPDSNYRPNKPFNGIVFVDDWKGSPITKYKFERSGTVLKWNGDNTTPDQSGIQAESTQKETAGVVETCSTIYGYNYAENDPEDTYYWSESGGCTYSVDQSYADVGGTNGSTGIGIGTVGSKFAINTVPTIFINEGDDIIANIVDYFKCFTNIGGTNHIFTALVCVDQPYPGTRECWGWSWNGLTTTGNPVDAGHAFLVLSENSPSGVITRNVGFYPASLVIPGSPIAQGQLNNDARHSYDISLSITINSEQFFTILDYIERGNNTGFNYNLNTNNCTTFVINALSQADIYLPSTIGNWTVGSGNDPGDLGEDIRNMTLSSNMVRNTVSNFHPNIGTCN
jgi:surface antigen